MKQVANMKRKDGTKLNEPGRCEGCGYSVGPIQVLCALCQHNMTVADLKSLSR